MQGNDITLVVNETMNYEYYDKDACNLLINFYISHTRPSFLKEKKTFRTVGKCSGNS